MDVTPPSRHCSSKTLKHVSRAWFNQLGGVAIWCVYIVKIVLKQIKSRQMLLVIIPNLIKSQFWLVTYLRSQYHSRRWHLPWRPSCKRGQRREWFFHCSGHLLGSSLQIQPPWNLIMELRFSLISRSGTIHPGLFCSVVIGEAAKIDENLDLFLFAINHSKKKKIKCVILCLTWLSLCMDWGYTGKAGFQIVGPY